MKERKKVRSKSRNRLPENEREVLERTHTGLSEKIRSLRENISLCEDIINRSDELERKMEMAITAEGKEIKRHERER